MTADAPGGIRQVVLDYELLIDRCAHVNQFTRSAEVQERMLSEIAPLIERVKAVKARAAALAREGMANEMFHLQCMLRSMESSLRVWLSIKEGEPQAAWSHLVDAREYKDAALLVKDYEGVRAMERQLDAMERALFPHHALFNSAGFAETIGECSICGGPFRACDHIERRVYMGRLCRRVGGKFIEALHVAFVERPLDKRCVITRHSNKAGRMIDQFTLEDLGPRPDGGGDGMVAEAVFMTVSDLDFD